jgi:hypothetical protein
MTPHQSFTDICTISLMYLGSKISMSLGQAVPPDDWMAKITGPLGGFVVMCIGIYYMAQRNAKQDIKTEQIREAQELKAEEIRKAQELKDEAHLQSRIESVRLMTEILESTKNVIAQNSPILSKATKVLEKHKCVDND